MLFDISFTINGYTLKTVADSLSPAETIAAIQQITAIVRQLPPIAAPQQHAPATGDVKIMAISHVTRSHDGEKEIVRVFGEPYLKYGVAVYPDSCKVGYELIPATLGRKDLSGYEAQIAMKPDGNPSRVIGIQQSSIPF